MIAQVGQIFTIDHRLLGQARAYIWRKKLADLQTGDLLEINTRPEGGFDYVYVVFRELRNNDMMVDSCIDQFATELLILLQHVTRVAVIDEAAVCRAQAAIRSQEGRRSFLCSLTRELL